MVASIERGTAHDRIWPDQKKTASSRHEKKVYCVRTQINNNVQVLTRRRSKSGSSNKVRNSSQLMEVVCIHKIVDETRTGTVSGLN